MFRAIDDAIFPIAHIKVGTGRCWGACHDIRGFFIALDLGPGLGPAFVSLSFLQ